MAVPESPQGTAALIADYADSPLAAFHAWFYSRQPHEADQWPSTYDRAPLWQYPPCARKILQQPNEALLKPGSIRHVVRRAFRARPERARRSGRPAVRKQSVVSVSWRQE